MPPIHFQLSPPADPACGEALLEIAGELVLANVKEGWQQMRAALTRYDSVRVVMRSVTQVDLSFLQLCYAARRTCGQSGKSCVFELELSGEPLMLLSRAGFGNIVEELKG